MLYIKIVNDTPVEHPVFAQNLLEAFPGIATEDFVTLGYVPFVRVELVVPFNKRFLKTEYEKVDGIWTDVHYFRDLSPEEVAAQAAFIKSSVDDWWAKRPFANNYTAWVYDETLGRYVPPFPMPKDGKFYRWSGKDNNWKEAEPFPQDGKKYTFDFDNWVNVEVVSNEGGSPNV
jgi:hypothetical protein